VTARWCRDPLNRQGRGVEIQVAAGGGPLRSVRVIFAPETSELLECSQNDDVTRQVHTFLRFGHVAAIGDRP
jgi:hypothetical protein